MAETVYDNGEISFTRFWMGECDGVQISYPGGYTQMSIAEFREAYKAVEEDVNKTKGAFWHPDSPFWKNAEEKVK